MDAQLYAGRLRGVGCYESSTGDWIALKPANLRCCAEATQPEHPA
jgi:hypothetical protein